MKQLTPLLVIALLIALPLPMTIADDSGESLFDGKTLKGWDGNPAFWSVKDGVISGQTTPENPTKGNTFLIWRGGKVGDFQLDLDFRIVGGNSGIQYRSREMPNWVVGGYQADFDAPGKYCGILYEERGRGIIALRGKKVVIDKDGKKNVVGETCDEKKVMASIKNEDWNHYTIIAKGNHLIQKVNGHVPQQRYERIKESLFFYAGSCPENEKSL